MQHGKRPLANHAAAEDQHVHARCACEAAHELAFAAVDRQHGFKPKQRPLFPRCLAVRRAEAVAVLCSDRNALAVKNRLHLFRVSCRVDATIDHLAFPQIAVFRRLNFLDLGQKIAPLPHLLRRFHNRCAHLRIRLIGEPRFCSAVLLNEHRMPRAND